MGPPRSCRPQMGPMLAPWTLISGYWAVRLHRSCTTPYCADTQTPWLIKTNKNIDGWSAILNDYDVLWTRLFGWEYIGSRMAYAMGCNNRCVIANQCRNQVFFIWNTTKESKYIHEQKCHIPIVYAIFTYSHNKVSACIYIIAEIQIYWFDSLQLEGKQHS